VESNRWVKCDECGREFDNLQWFCPYCGADQRLSVSRARQAIARRMKEKYAEATQARD
jgi:hypothetical protein